MTIIKEMESSFKRRQTSYKMVTILAMLEKCSSKGVANIQNVVEYFADFYKKRNQSLCMSSS